MNCRSRVCLSTPIYTNHRYNYKTPDLFSLSRIFTDLIMHNYRSNQSALMTRCGTDFRHQYGIFGGESQTSVSRNATRPGAKKDGCFRRLLVQVIALTTTIGMGVVAFLSKGLIGGITKAIYTTMIRDAAVFTDVNLDNKK